MKPLALEVESLGKSFAGLSVIRDLSFTVPAGSSTALIGPNGAGKSTAFNLITGVYRPDRGRIRLNGKDITATASRRRVGFGIARNFQNIRLMPHLSVLENLLVGQHVRAGKVSDLLTPFRLLPNHRWQREALEALVECGLDRHANDTVQGLPYGIRKRIDLVRATLSRPGLLLLDEPAAGLNPTETHALHRHLDMLRARGMTLLVVEHDMHFVGRTCSHVVVLNFGEKIAEGTLAEVQRSPQVREAYLGSVVA